MDVRGSRPTPGQLLVATALIVMTAGTAVAASKIGTADIQSGAVTGKKLAAKSVGNKKLKDAAVTAPKIANGAITGSQVANDTLNDTKLSDYEVIGNSPVQVVATEAPS